MRLCPSASTVAPEWVEIFKQQLTKTLEGGAYNHV
jgi:hypothetical protein